MMSLAAAGARDLQVIPKSCKAVTDGGSWKGIGGLVVNGAMEVGGSTATFSDVIDFRTGYYKRQVHTGHIYIEAQIEEEGAKGLFRIDTGDGGAVTVFKAFADAHSLFAGGGRASIDAGGLGGTLTTREFDGARLAIAGTIFEKVPVTLADARAGSFASRSLAGNLGAAVLGRFRITFDYHARTITFRPTTNATRPFPRGNAGLSVTQSRPDRLEVLSVQPESRAFRANIRANDAIVQINGASVGEDKLGVFDLLSLLSGPRAINVTIERDGVLTEATIVPDLQPATL